MGSTFITLEPSSVDNSGLFKNSPPQLVWLQFVPGHVEKIYTEPSAMSGVIEASAHEVIIQLLKLLPSTYHC